MTSEGLLRGFFAFLFAGALALGIWMRSDGETAGEDVSRARERRLSPIIAPFMLPLFLSALVTAVTTPNNTPAIGHTIQVRCHCMLMKLHAR